MSVLKEEWASLMKLRESGYADEAKKQEIKSRIFDNFSALRKELVREVPSNNEISIKPDYQTMRNQFLNSVSFTTRAKTPEIPKKFEFGLKNLAFPPTELKKNRPELKSDEIWGLPDSPYKETMNSILPDKFEITSIATSNSSLPIPSYSKKEINILCDLSPITRHLSTYTQEQEENYLKESKKLNFFANLSLVHIEPNSINFEFLG